MGRQGRGLLVQAGELWLLDIWIEAMYGEVQSRIYLDHEWGWSGSDIVMQSSVTVNVTRAIGDEDRTYCGSEHIAH